MGIITILWEKWVEFRRDFYKITLGCDDCAPDVSCRIWNGYPDGFARSALSEFPDSGCRLTDHHEWKF